eukprot:6185364-Pleurochrysis_carterae.AAC.2
MNRVRFLTVSTWGGLEFGSDGAVDAAGAAAIAPERVPPAGPVPLPWIEFDRGEEKYELIGEGDSKK